MGWAGQPGSTQQRAGASRRPPEPHQAAALLPWGGCWLSRPKALVIPVPVRRLAVGNQLQTMGFTCHEGTCKGSSTKRFIRALRSLVKVRHHTGSDRHARLISSHLGDSLSCTSHVVLFSGRAVEKRRASPAVRDRR